MKTGSCKKVLLALAAAALMFAYGAAEAQAGWGILGGGSRGGSWGGSSGFGSGGGSGGSWGGSRGGRLFGGSRGGPIRNLIGRIRSNHSHGGSGGSWGGSRGGHSRGGSWGGGSYGSRSYASRGGSRGGSWGGGSGGYSYRSASIRYGSSGGGYGGGGSVGYRSYYTPSMPAYSQPVSSQPVISQPYYNNTIPNYAPSAPIEYGTPVDSGFPVDSYPADGGIPVDGTVFPPGQPTPATPMDGSTPPPGPERTSTDVDNGSELPADISDDDTALLNLRVPTQAVVYVNGQRTSTPGSFRSYVSRNLKPGKNYTYEVRAEVERDGKTLARTKLVQLSAGTKKTFDMEFDTEEELITSVTLFVPEDAKVSLGGVETNASGPMRYFSTSSLKDGDAWKSYQVAVTVNRDGKPVTRNRVIDVNAGDSVNLRFDFDTLDEVATR